MTTATATMSNGTMTEARPRRSLEELVDWLIDALFREETETAERDTRPQDTGEDAAIVVSSPV